MSNNIIDDDSIVSIDDEDECIVVTTSTVINRNDNNIIDDKDTNNNNTRSSIHKEEEAATTLVDLTASIEKAPPAVLRRRIGTRSSGGNKLVIPPELQGTNCGGRVVKKQKGAVGVSAAEVIIDVDDEDLIWEQQQAMSGFITANDNKQMVVSSSAISPLWESDSTPLLGTLPIWDSKYFVQPHNDFSTDPTQKVFPIQQQRSLVEEAFLLRQLPILQDGHAMIAPKYYAHPDSFNLAGVSVTQPFHVVVHPQVQILTKFHAALATSEIIGILGGRYVPAAAVDSSNNNKSNKIGTLYIQMAIPCKAAMSGGTDVEMDPVSLAESISLLDKHQLKFVGWYHSHPKFEPCPSVTDLINQNNFQRMFQCSNTVVTEPFVGLIVRPPSKATNFEYECCWFHILRSIPQSDHLHNLLKMGYFGVTIPNDRGENEPCFCMQLYVQIRIRKESLASFPRQLHDKLPLKQGDCSIQHVSSFYNKPLELCLTKFYNRIEALPQMISVLNGGLYCGVCQKHIYCTTTAAAQKYHDNGNDNTNATNDVSINLFDEDLIMSILERHIIDVSHCFLSSYAATPTPVVNEEPELSCCVKSDNKSSSSNIKKSISTSQNTNGKKRGHHDGTPLDECNYQNNNSEVQTNVNNGRRLVNGTEVDASSSLDTDCTNVELQKSALPLITNPNNPAKRRGRPRKVKDTPSSKPENSNLEVEGIIDTFTVQTSSSPKCGKKSRGRPKRSVSIDPITSLQNKKYEITKKNTKRKARVADPYISPWKSFGLTVCICHQTTCGSLSTGPLTKCVSDVEGPRCNGWFHRSCNMGGFREVFLSSSLSKDLHRPQSSNKDDKVVMVEEHNHHEDAISICCGSCAMEIMNVDENRLFVPIGSTADADLIRSPKNENVNKESGDSQYMNPVRIHFEFKTNDNDCKSDSKQIVLGELRSIPQHKEMKYILSQISSLVYYYSQWSHSDKKVSLCIHSTVGNVDPCDRMRLSLAPDFARLLKQDQLPTTTSSSTAGHVSCQNGTLHEALKNDDNNRVIIEQESMLDVICRFLRSHYRKDQNGGKKKKRRKWY